MKIQTFILAIYILLAACSEVEKQDTVSKQSWEQISESAKGKTATLMMWQGDPLINQYISDYIVPEVKENLDINLQIVAGQGNTIVNTLMTEIEAGKQSSEIDMMWINGETFFQLRQIKALYGPFVDKLPNSQFVDWDNPFISTDFQQPVDGYECPWGNVQLALIYNSDKLETPPMDLKELETFLQENPGKFTFSNDFTGMTLLKSWLISLAGGKGALKGDFDENKYAKYSQELWDYINRVKPNFWNNGETFPASLAQVHQLFTSGEIWFTMSNNDGEVDNKILQGLFPESSRAYVPETGTIQNSHFMGIVKHSANKEAAMAVINFLISPEAQWEKMQPAIWGDGTILSQEKLPEEWQNQFKEIPGRIYAPDRKSIQSKALMEPAPEYMIRLFEDFRKEVIEK